MLNPKVTFVMPTYNRPIYAQMAIRCFRQQTYPNVELVIVNDGEKLNISDENKIICINLSVRTPTGTKRNIGAYEAKGDVIASLDDDDWSASYRLEDQVQRLLKTKKAVTGYNSTVVYDEENKEFYKNMGGPPYFASGTSQCYLKEWWKTHPFPDCTHGEDSVFSRIARLADELSIADVGKTMVARKHANNTDYVYIQKLKKLSYEDISDEFFSTLRDEFKAATRVEAEKQFQSTLIDYKIDWLPEVITR